MERQSNREGIKGMMNPTRYGIERFAYWLQRLTGLGLLFYLIGHIIETSAIVEGKAAWDKMLELTQTTEGHIILILVIGMSVFHTVNGIRVMLGHGGIGVGKPGRPDYPYRPASLNYKQRLCIWVSIALAALAMMYGAGILFGE
ncbi:MAG TPA: succinate dehydrogenase [Nitrosopumilaceae archaeon]|nr:succinate dehydrogenase [Nitrosopumilaceae archaeon]